MLGKLMQAVSRNKGTAEAATAQFMGNRGQSANRAVSLVVALTVGGLVAAFLLPIAIDEIVGVDTTSWSSGASSLWDIMDVIIVLALFLFMIGLATARRLGS
jgi:small-conductance mechanosensitive channel